MLVLTRKPNQSILLYPSQGLDPDMTVRELLAKGRSRSQYWRSTGTKPEHGHLTLLTEEPVGLLYWNSEMFRSGWG